MLVAVALFHEALQEPFEIFDDRGLKLIHKDRGGGVERIQNQYAILDLVLRDDLSDRLSDVEELGARFRRNRDRLTNDFHSPPPGFEQFVESPSSHPTNGRDR